MTDFPELAQLRALADPDKAAQAAEYHKVAREYLGVAVPVIDDLARTWREGLDLPARLDLAARLWDSDVHEGRIAAAKLLTQARIRPDDAAWRLIAGWVAQFDGAAIADHVMKAGEKRLVADPSRLAEVEGWLDHPDPWVRRAALTGTLPWTRIRNPKPADLAQRDQILGWLSRLAGDRQNDIQKTIGVWLRDLSKHDPQRVRDWLAADGAQLRPAARREAARWLPDDGKAQPE
ncbi:DNA alkylation repair protein [Paracoccus shanxieyensis]|uniref:DNA alkylation repair protein n=1 Tax=Paracoccus shanxieyensis TaxID=2675752 RepID=A0A6L6IVT8_9RHOB|nr:DNA alkylation repair protein [Paracoccus shanxieyensis]MTH64333.1 DNA alkylation repair protein [Paracoccus shanxieyensis]MTH87674.1 DNA alkylation repair protein [Paracoccus shanxieyensis]